MNSVRFCPSRLWLPLLFLAAGWAPGPDRVGAQPAGGPAAADLQVRLFWIVSAPRREEAGKTLDEFKEAIADLARLGIDHPRIAAHVAVNTRPRNPFEVTGVVDLVTPCRLSVTGSLSDAREAVEMEVRVAVTRIAPGPMAGSVICQLRSQATVPLDRPLVLGASPADGQKSAFVVQVQRREQTGSPGKLAAFEFRDTPWSRVLDWLSDRTGLPVVTNSKPTGTFTFVPPRKGTTYTVPEVIDVVNEGLLGQHYLVVRSEHALHVVPADEKIDPALVPRVRPEELDRFGRTELVSVVVSLKSLTAEDLAPEVKKMLGPFGEVLVLKKANRLVLTDGAGNLRRVYQLLGDLDDGVNRKK